MKDWLPSARPTGSDSAELSESIRGFDVVRGRPVNPIGTVKLTPVPKASRFMRNRRKPMLDKANTLRHPPSVNLAKCLLFRIFEHQATMWRVSLIQKRKRYVFGRLQRNT